MSKKLLSLLLAVCMICTLLPFGVLADEAEEAITWNLEDGVLTISGIGDMDDNSLSALTNDDKGSVTAVVIEDGVTGIGAKAFENCAKLESVAIPASVVKIGDNAFTGCEKLADVYYGGTEADAAEADFGTGNTLLIGAKRVHYGVSADAVADHYAETVVEPTCLNKGYTLHKCTCETPYEYKSDVKAASGHVWDEGKVTKEPTCTEAGEKIYKCTVEGCEASRTEVIAAVGHDYEQNPTDVLGASCKKSGFAIYKCVNCGDTYREWVKSLDHAWDEGEVTKEPTCSVEGEIVYKCTRDGCNKTKTEAIAKLDHVWDEGIVTKDATCNKTGSKKLTCTVCGEKKIEKIPVIGHEWSEYKLSKAATCEEDGEITRTCATCNRVETEAIAKLGHAWDEGTVTKAATEKGTGIKTYKCTRDGCSATKTQTIPKVLHTCPFVDLLDSGYHEWIEKAAAVGIINGYSDGSYRPKECVTRAQFITMMYRAVNAPKSNGSLNFKDNGAIAEAYKNAVAWGVSNKIILGYNDNTFRPNQNISRAQMATFVYRYMKNIANYNFGNVTPVNFSDKAQIESPYVEAVNAIVSAGIMNGTSATTFAPNGTANRGMAAKVMFGVYDLLNK